MRFIFVKNFIGLKKLYQYKIRSVIAILLGAMMIVAAGCGTKKNTPLSRNWQAFTTRYNVYFNGHEHYLEQLKSQEQKYEDDYTRFVLTHPAEAYADEKAPRPTGDFKRTIEKMQKAIQLHSIKKKPAKKSGSAKEKAFRARDEFNPFLHNAWMTMGLAQFYGGDFLAAASTFLYISKHFPWLSDVTTEAKIWQARCYCAMDWLYEAENILVHIKEKDLTNKNLQRLYALTKGDWLVRSQRYEEAIPQLTIAAKGASGSQKNRLWFLIGQLYAQTGNKKMAYEAFKKAGAGASTAYRTKFNARIKQSEVFEGTDITKEVKALKGMLHYQRNNEFQDQIYYAIGNLYLSRGDSAEAVKNYRLAVEKSTRNGIDKALANVALGGIYFSEHEYVKAQPCYSEAIPQLPETFPNYKMLSRRSDVLDELALYAGNVELQDSLLDLSKMTDEEKMAVCQRLADELIKREKEEAEAAAREEYLEKNKDANDRIGQDAATGNFTMNNDKSWYFYNTMSKNQGKNEFIRRWGNRKLEDDWRRRNKTTFAFSEDEPDNGENPNGEGESADGKSTEKNDSIDAANDPHSPLYYFKQIPSTPEEIQTANDVVMEGLYNMGVILKDKLEDFNAARSEFNRLESRYPDNIYRLDVYYNMYLMAVRENDPTQAEIWRSKILSDFPDSPYGQAMKDPQYFDNLRKMHDIQEELYAETYQDYLDNRNREVHESVARMEQDFPLSTILPKFIFIDALSYLTEKEYGRFQERLEELLRRWPDTDMTDMAGSILKGLQAGRQPNAGATNSRGMIWEMRLTDSDQPIAEDGKPANFERDPNSPQYMVFAFPKDEVNSNQLLYDVARFNFSTFTVLDFDLEQMSFGNVGLLIVKGLQNLRQAERYREMLDGSAYLELPAGVRPIIISKPNFELLLREGRSFDEYFRFLTNEAVPDPEDSAGEEGRPRPVKSSEDSAGEEGRPRPVKSSESSAGEEGRPRPVKSSESSAGEEGRPRPVKSSESSESSEDF